MLNQANIKSAHEIGKEGTWDFNCWGATLFVLDESEELFWCSKAGMEEFLHCKTVQINKNEVREGDILVMYDYQGLTHTAVYIGNGKYFHKCGSGRSYFHNENEVLGTYDYNDIEYRRKTREV